MDDFGRLTEFVPGRIWTKRVPLRFFGLPVGARMTVVRLGDGELLVHSPTSLDDELRADLERLGSVHVIIAPNRFHHLFVTDYLQAFPEAHLYGAATLRPKRPDLPFHGLLDDEAEPDWRDEIRQVVVRGIPVLDEVVFLDEASGTLIVSDLLQCVTSADPWLMRLVGRLEGAYGTPTLVRSLRLLTRDRQALRDSVERILEWNFNRIVMAHGPLVEIGGKDLMRRAFAWLR